MSEGNPHEHVTVTDKRRIDPETGEVRHVASGAAPSGAAPDAAPDAAEADKVAELTADLQRVQADYANYRKRALRDQEATAERAKAAVVSQLLGVLDDLERARSHGDLDSGPLKSVADKLFGALSGLGLSAFGAEGDDFDPALHEAVQHEGDGRRLHAGDRHRHATGIQTRGPGAAARAGRRGGHRLDGAAVSDTADTDTVDNDANEGEQHAESEPSEK